MEGVCKEFRVFKASTTSLEIAVIKIARIAAATILLFFFSSLMAMLNLFKGVFK